MVYKNQVLSKQINLLDQLSLQRLCFVSFFLGGVGAMALPPTYAFPMILAFSALLLILDSCMDRPQPLKSSFWTTWSFGFGYFTFGLYWIANALTVDIAKFWWVTPFSILGLPFILAFFTAIPGVLCGLLRWRGVMLGLAFAIFWVIAEWLRSFVLTGFPWNFTGYMWCFSDEMLQITSITGIYGLSFLTLLLAAGFLCLLQRPYQWLAGGITGLTVAIFLFGSLRLNTPTETFDDVWLRIVQPSIPQTSKWDPVEKEKNFEKLLSLSSLASSHKINAIIWPETAVPFFIEQEGFRRDLIEQVIPNEGFLLTGAPRRTPYGVSPVEIWNSILALNSTGDVVAHYDKSHLVPFGEYFPLRRYIEPYFAVRKITAGAQDFSSGSGPSVLQLGSLPPFGGQVCYESIFPGKVVNREQERPQWLLNVTNDAWYGNSPGPYQHLQISRVRSIEEGLPMVRAANTGISAVFDAYGRELDRLELMAIGNLDFQLPKPSANVTIYGTYGNILILGLLGLIFIGLAILNRRGTYERFYLHQ